MNGDILIGIVGAIVGGVLTILLMHYTSHAIIDFRVADHGVDVILLSFIRIPYVKSEDIEKVAKVDIWGIHRYLPACIYITRLWGNGGAVLIRRKSGLVRNYVVTPIDADDFIHQLR